MLIHSVECNRECRDRAVTFRPVLSEADTTMWIRTGGKEGGNRGRQKERRLIPQALLASPDRKGFELINFDLLRFLLVPYDVQIQYEQGISPDKSSLS